MEFGIENCGMLIMKKRINRRNGSAKYKIRKFGEKENY